MRNLESSEESEKLDFSFGVEWNQTLEGSRFDHIATSAEIEKRLVDRIPAKTLNQNAWAIKVWKEWAIWRNTLSLPYLQKIVTVPVCIETCSKEELGFWLTRFVLEVKRQDNKPYPFNTLYNICAALQRHLRMQNKGSMCDLFIFNKQNFIFYEFNAAFRIVFLKLFPTRFSEYRPW